MKTSSRIALQFTIWIALIIAVLLVFLNVMFFFGWLRGETQNLAQRLLPPKTQISWNIWSWIAWTQGSPFPFPHQDRFMTVQQEQFSPSEYKPLLGIDRVRFFDDRRWIIGRNERTFVILDVSQNVDRQIWLAYMSTLLWALVSLGSFFFGRLFVHKSLRDLRILINKLNHRKISDKNPSLTADHLPVDDEINAIATAITNLENRVVAHYENLRTFVWHVSHELKTPLMVMRSDIDLADRTKTYDGAVESLRTNIYNMQHMIDTLLTLSRLQAQENIETTPVWLEEILNHACQSLQKKYTDKDMEYTLNIDPLQNSIPANEHLIRMLCINLLDNAWKYSKNNSQIDIEVVNDKLTITNPGHISQETISHMREPFWQNDKNRVDGIGVWLSIVENIARVHNWEINYDCIDNHVICTVKFG